VAAGTVVAIGAVLALAACAQDAKSQAQTASEGIAYGASIETWREAFKEVAPITIVAQSSAPQGSAVGKMYEEYWAEVEEWSDGKITFDISYSNAIAATLEVDDALRDGRLDMGNVLPVYEPDQYPLNAALADASFIGDQAPNINPLMLHGAMNDVAWSTPQFREEYESNGMVPVLPWFSGDSNGIQCVEPTSSLADFKGRQVVAAGRVNALELEALGASPVSMPYTELFEALQRGVVDCSLNSMRVATLMGTYEVARNFTIDDEVGLAKNPGGWALSKSKWDSLPLVAQQLLFDKTRVILDNNIAGSTKFQVDGLATILEQGGQTSTFDDAARQAVKAANDKALEAMRESSNLDDGQKLVDDMRAATTEWASKVADDLGFGGDVAFADFPDWHKQHGYDLSAYLDAVYEKAMNQARPA
ncbi:C4-dicarboxylate ABC transporter substrate-binding protein, partial [Georgenia ruanii]|nr:C4-dicarboxylate ABC transporter substrate-binding protein [Georgenia ruanii]